MNTEYTPCKAGDEYCSHTRRFLQFFVICGLFITGRPLQFPESFNMRLVLRNCNALMTTTTTTTTTDCKGLVLHAQRLCPFRNQLQFQYSLLGLVWAATHRAACDSYSRLRLWLCCVIPVVYAAKPHPSAVRMAQCTCVCSSGIHITILPAGNCMYAA